MSHAKRMLNPSRSPSPHISSDADSSDAAVSNAERERWNRKYSQADASTALLPDAFLPQAFSRYILPAFPTTGRALDLAAGAGRHAIWLAQQGWEVTLIDISETGIEVARRHAGPLATRLHFVVDDLTRYRASQTAQGEQFDVVMVFYFLDRVILPEIINSLRPGGLLIYKTFTESQQNFERGPKHPDHLLKPSELLKLTAGLKVLHYQERVSDSATAEIVARKEC